MNIDDYFIEARKTNLVTQDKYPETFIHHQLIGLFGEVGELSEKIKKFERDIAPIVELNEKELINDSVGEEDNLIYYEDYKYEKQREEIKKELGDVFWYLVNFIDALEMSPSKILQMNLDKLKKRQEENKLRGSGDDR
jgi:NTP pyrophosphatase (non-canonical NTP hydrolase)